MMSITLIRYFAYLFFLLSMPICNLALEINPFVEENIKCVESEKQALLTFKKVLVDEYDVLSSWETQVNSDCCNWRGVRCSNKTEGHRIIRLDLRGSYDKYLKGEVGSSLTQLSHLNYLDLSYNRFDQILFEDIGSLVNLNYLNLSHNWLANDHHIPPHLGNLSKLSVLDLGSNAWLKYGNLRWLSSLSSLEHLVLSGGDFGGANDWVSVINKLPLLQRLLLRSCSLPPPILPSHSYTNLSRFLVELDLAENYYLNSSIYHSWLINFTSLVHLDLAYNILEGFNFDDFGNMTSLVSLNLRSTNINFGSLKAFESLFNLHSLDLYGNNIGGLLSDFLKALHPRVLYSLEYLNLAGNKFLGFLPDFTMLPSLKELELYGNMLSGTIPQNLGQLSHLEILAVGWNSLEGDVSETHFSNLTNLKQLHLSNNSLNLNFKTDWIPPFQLNSIYLSHLKLGPLFPRWLRTQNLSVIDISFAEINIIPQWFWNNLSPKLDTMDLSGNKMMGEIPNLSVKFETEPFIALASNKFVGRIPAFLFQAWNLDLSSNNFSDLSGLCEIVNSPLFELDISDNQLSGQLPNCWDSMLNLGILDLSNNYLSGDLPHSMSNLFILGSLMLPNNQFSGGLHFSLFNLTKLKIFDVMNNNLSGTIPSWIGSKLPNLIFLNLKSNHFHGNLPLSLCNLKNIQVLDISSNNISGSIPTCIGNFKAFTQTSQPQDHNSYGYIVQDGSNELQSYLHNFVMMWKGQERLIQGEVLKLERSIDLSCNHLSGKIPNEIIKLVGLITLNLSRNELTGQIPDKIGQLQSLDFLDLSRNHLSGPIPSSISQISRLGELKLSYNNLSGKIPTATQLQTFPTSSYEGNPFLCGDPLKKCFEEITQDPSSNNNVHVGNEKEDEDKLFVREFMMSMAFGFIVGFWAIFGSLVLNRRWRHAYFKLFRCRNN